MVMDMVCNFKKCRKPLPDTAWVTSCSHAFCIEHGESEFAKRVQEILFCPACRSQLNDKFDVVQADLNPPETFKSIVLAGMKPDVIMDIAMRAMSFWSYQMEEESRYHENIGRHARERAKALEECHNVNLQRIKTEILSNKNKIETLQAECDKQKRQSEDYAAKLEDRNRKIQRLQYQLDNQRRNAIHINPIDEDSNKMRQNVGNIVSNRYDAAPEQFTFQPQMIKNNNNGKKRVFENITPIMNNKDNFRFHPVTPSERLRNRQS